MKSELAKIKWTLKNKQKEICFNEENHTYIYKNGDKFSSVSSIVKKFKERFDKQYHSKRIAKRTGRPQKEILKEWSIKGYKAANRGTKIHLQKEKMLNGLIEPGKHVKQLFKSGWELLDTELILFQEEYKIAGQADILMVNKDEVILLDWKTNSKDINRKNPYNKNLKAPFSSFPDTLYGKYSLQLNFYKDMLRNWGVPVNKMGILHLYKGDCKLIQIKDIPNSLDKATKKIFGKQESLGGFNLGCGKSS